MLIGSAIGKTPFARSISPTKTVEGLIGAIFVPTFVSVLFYLTGEYTEGDWAIRMPIYDYVFLGVSLSSLAVMGDLCESFLKRCANVKDSGVIM